MLETEAFVKAITSIQVALAIFNNGFIYAYWQPSICYYSKTKMALKILSAVGYNAKELRAVGYNA